jgi:trehalose synthase
VSGNLQPMAVSRRPLGDYAPACGEDGLERLLAAAAPLEGTRVVHVSVADGGGRVPELLSAGLPLAAELGLAVEWLVLFGGPELEPVSRALRDGLQGAETAIEDATLEAYRATCEAAAGALPADLDLVVLHDPGALGLAQHLEAPALWHCHVDASQPDAAALDPVVPLAERCRALAFPLAGFAPSRLRGRPLHELAPGIDPLSPRNLELAPGLAGRVVRPFGIDLSRPFVCQLMRLDRWKDPHATVEAFAAAREELPALQLVIAVGLDAADPHAWRALRELTDYAAGRPDVHVLTSYAGVGDVELCALQRLARVSVQLSIREGFGLAASEALWKTTPVVGGRQGGLPSQVRDRRDGYLVESPEHAAARIVELVRDPGLAVEMGRSGRERVGERFLVTRALEDEIKALGAVAGATVDAP